MDLYNWGIVGFGRASQARIRALSRLGQNIQAIATQRAQLFEEWVTQNSDVQLQEISIFEDWRELVQSTDINGVFICSDNEQHFEQARHALVYGKHVCVEFPPCSTIEEATILYELAQKNHITFHVESIGTLTDRHRHLKSLIKNRQIDHLQFSFTGGLYRWVESEAKKGRIAHLSFGRLHQLIDLFGDVIVSQSKIDMVKSDESIESYRLEAQFRTPTYECAMALSLAENRAKGGRRSNEVYASKEGCKILLAQSRKGSLFEQDTKHFIQLCFPTHHYKITNSEYSEPHSIIKTLSLINDIYTQSQRSKG